MPQVGELSQAIASGQVAIVVIEKHNQREWLSVSGRTIFQLAAAIPLKLAAPVIAVSFPRFPFVMSGSQTLNSPSAVSNETSDLDPTRTSASPESDEHSLILAPNEDVSAIAHEDLKERYLDLKDEIWKRRRDLALDPVTGLIPNNWSHVSQNRFLQQQRVAVFIDVQNLYYSAKRSFGQSLSYARMLHACVGTRQLVRAIAYVVEREGVNQSKFFNVLYHAGIEVRTRPAIEREAGLGKAEWEVGMATDMLQLAGKVDSIIVASGNGVFADAAPLIQAAGARFECCTFKDSASAELIQSVDSYHFL